MESGAGWAPFWVQRMDEHWEQLHKLLPAIQEKPSFYFKRQCFLGVESDDEMLPHLVAAGMEDHLIFSSDFPHPDSIYPGAVTALTSREDLSAAVKRKALRDNALRMYND